MPHVLGPLLGSGILLASIVAVVLNLFFNQLKVPAVAVPQPVGASLVSEG
jgi:xanthine/uracil permease